MSAVSVGEPGTDTLLIFGIRNMAEVKKEGRYLALLLRREGRDPLFDFFDVHSGQNTAGSVQSKRASRITTPSSGGGGSGWPSLSGGRDGDQAGARTPPERGRLLCCRV